MDVLVWFIVFGRFKIDYWLVGVGEVWGVFGCKCLCFDVLDLVMWWLEFVVVFCFEGYEIVGKEVRSSWGG